MDEYGKDAWIEIPVSHYFGGIHPSAVIGHSPELRDWRPGDKTISPRIHRTARIGALCTVDAGSQRATQVGARSWLMKRVHLGHDVQVGCDCELAPGVTIGGEVTIGNKVRIGVNACVKPRVTIGDGARIGAGAVVTKDVPAGEVWVGNPAHELVKKPVSIGCGCNCSSTRALGQRLGLVPNDAA